MREIGHPLTDLLKKRIDHVSNSGVLASFTHWDELERIDDRYYLEDKTAGISLVIHLDMTISSINLHSSGHEGFEAFKGELPLGVSITDNRETVLSKLGQPVRSGGGATVPVLGPTSVWDRYEFDDFFIHLQYSDGGNLIEMVTLMDPEVAPG